MSRFFTEPQNVGENYIIIDSREELHHMMKVLRLQPGNVIDISDSSEWEYKAEIIRLDKDSAEARIIDKQRFTAEPGVDITLFQGIPKQGKMEIIVQKAVELGVNRIVPVFMKRTVVTDKGNFGKKIDRWQRVSAEAVKQCKRGIVPEVLPTVKMNDVIGGFGDFDIVLFPYENEKGLTIKDVLREFAAERQKGAGTKKSKIAVIIGPEGGFSDEEAEAVKSAGGISVSLGKTILRTETAGMAALSMIMYELEL